MAGTMQATRGDETADAGSQAANTFIATVYFKQATTLLDRGQYAEAEAYYREALRIWPDHAASLNNLGTAVWRQGRTREAEEYHRRALDLNPADYAILNNLGNMLWEQGQLDEAVGFYRRAVELRPDSPEAHMNFGVNLSDLGECDEGLHYLRESLRLAPHAADAHLNLGNTLARQGDLDAALHCYEHALTLRADYPEARRNRSYIWLTRGDLERGWAEYEWRLKCEKQRILPVGTPRWNGEDLAGRSILLVSEQGLGDTLQFIRFAALVKQRAARVELACPAPLVRLLTHTPGVDGVVDWMSTLPEGDVHVPLLSVPAIVGTTQASIPAEPYLSVDARAVEEWRPTVERAVRRGMSGDDPVAPGRPFTIGIVWQGNAGNTVDRSRSFPLAHFAHLAEVRGVCLLSLQKGAGTEQLAAQTGRFRVAELFDSSLGEEDRRDFLDTAAVMTQLDLVVTPDTSVAHLAGGLGVPVWLALPAAAEWRWLLGRDDSPWYPTMRLFRQSHHGDWNGVFQRMAQALTKIVER